MELEILNHQQIKVPSASGIVSIDNNFYVIGDNPPFLFQLKPDFSILKKIELLAPNNLENEIFLKKDKPDFEAIASYKNETGNKILIFGSGSKSPQRDLAMEINIGPNFLTSSFSLVKFYSELREIGEISEQDFNIEAACIISEKLYLFNRGDNKILSCTLEDFFNCVANRTALTSVEFFKIKIPETEAFIAGFSAATHLASEDKILFTATVENTSNWYDDGEVIGSYLGFLDLKNLKVHPKPQLIPISREGELLKIKVEGVCILKNDASATEILMVTDSDGGASEIIHAKILK